MRILIVGADGRLGMRLEQAFRAQGHYTISSVNKVPDIALLEPTLRFVDDGAPDLVVHCAALTDVDYCAKDPDEALRINAIGTQHIALACQRRGIPLCYISTNEVFDGERGTPYLEYDTPRPINSYGYSKWVGEQVIRELVPQHYIVRIAWLFAHGGVNFLQKIVSLARAGKPLSVVTDEVASPTYTEDLVPALVNLLMTGRYGIYHLVNEGGASRYEFARRILDCYGLPDYPVTPIIKAQYPRPSCPPTYSVLRNFNAAHIGIRLRPWQEAVAAFVEREQTTTTETTSTP
jgi:dTDP-4-dehydrorhamnose reductase